MKDAELIQAIEGGYRLARESVNRYPDTSHPARDFLSFLSGAMDAKGQKKIAEVLSRVTELDCQTDSNRRFRRTGS